MYDPHIDLPSTAEWLQESRARITPCPPPIPEPDPDDEQMMSWAMGVANLVFLTGRLANWSGLPTRSRL